ncbi:MAG TPA: sulfite exporter TauE/SafE family protein [Flavobacteriales bacterium]|nr:sulfite exporter TauE/SafE family protein [Flavobacteriales bacterium]
MNTWLVAALAMGAAGSAHCIGMCGPIALAVPSPSNSRLSRWGSTLLLNSGRLATYLLLGAAVGTLGLGMRLAGLQKAVTIIGGSLLLVSVVLPGLLARFSPSGRMAMAIGRLRGLMARNLKRTAPEAIFLTGVLNGLLPCGLLYAALLGAATMSSPLEGALFMGAFGLGTWPALVALRMSAGLLGGKARAALRSVSPVLISIVAILMILRGLELGIPYVSPGPATMPFSGAECH